MHRFVAFVAVFATITLFIFTIKPSANEPQQVISFTAEQHKQGASPLASAVLSNLRAKADTSSWRKSKAAAKQPLTIQRKDSHSVTQPQE